MRCTCNFKQEIMPNGKMTACFFFFFNSYHVGNSLGHFCQFSFNSQRYYYYFFLGATIRLWFRLLGILAHDKEFILIRYGDKPSVSSFRTHGSHVSCTPTNSFSFQSIHTHGRARASNANARAPAHTDAPSLKICQFLPRGHVTSSSVEWMEMALHVSLRL